MIPGLGRSPGEGNGYPLQYSCLENSMDRGSPTGIGHDSATNAFTTTYKITTSLVVQWQRIRLPMQ